MAKKGPGRPPARTRQNFEEGKVDAWSAGEYGSTVRVIAKRGGILLRWQDAGTGKPRQATFAKTDTLELRARAARFAVASAEKLRAGVSAALDEPAEPGDRPQEKALGDLTLEDVVLLYMQRMPGFSREMLDWTEKQVERWHRALPEVVRKSPDNPSPSTLATDVRAFQRVFRSAALPRTTRVLSIEPAHIKALKNEWAGKYSPRTIANARDRLSCVFRHVMVYYRTSVGLLFNPIDGGKVDRSKAKVPRYTPEERSKLLSTARELIRKGRFWRLFVLLGMSQSGRRSGSMLQLTAADHDFEGNRVTWEAEHAKAENYGRGNDVRPMAPDHRTAVLWAISNHPNPLGPEYPIIWKKSNPAIPAKDTALRRDMHRVEALAGVEVITGRSIHSMRRAIVTLLADELGDGKAAEYTGMTVDTVRKFHYKQVVDEVMQEVAETIKPMLNAEDV